MFVVVVLLLFFGLLDFLLGFLFVCLDRLGLFGVVLFFLFFIFLFFGGGRWLIVGFGGGGSLVVAIILLCPSRKASSFFCLLHFPFRFCVKEPRPTPNISPISC